MLTNQTKQDSLFDLIKSLTKAEKRNFKLYATRQSANSEAMFISLFDTIDNMECYDEAKIIKKCKIKKSQLPNMKAHLYRQVLVSVRLIDVHHNTSIQLREQIDFARILYDKGLYRQSLKVLDKAKRVAEHNEQLTITLEIVEFEKTIETLNITRSGINRAELLSTETTLLCSRIDNSNRLSNIAIQLYGLYLKLGYIRSERDLSLIVQFFKPKLDAYSTSELGFEELIQYYQARMWYAYIQHDFVRCFKYSHKVIRLFDNRNDLRILYYDQLLKGYSRYLETLFFTRNYKRLVKNLDYFESSLMEEMPAINEHSAILTYLTYYFNKINLRFMEGNFDEGIKLVAGIEKFLAKYGSYIDTHHKLLLYYKVACLYFGEGMHRECITYLQRIIETKNVSTRRDLQCFARILNLVASYELGDDDRLDYQIRSVFTFIVKMNDMHNVQHEIMRFLKRLNYIYASDFKKELTSLYEKIKPYEQHPYERRTFFYLDLISWLESKINNVPLKSIVQSKFELMKK